MIGTRVRPAQGLQRDVRAKRAKRDYQLDNTAYLNASGICKLENGQDEEAETYFARALHQLETGLSEEIISNIVPNAEESNTIKEDKKSENLVDETPCSKSKLSYIYQRQEYDEGMYAYNEALPLQNGLSDTTSSAILLYNVAQTYVRRGKYEEAKVRFELSLERMLREAEATTDVLIFSTKIFNNIGHCLYRLGQNANAMSFYEKALETAQGIAHEDTLYTATCKNAIAVLLFHDESSNKELAMHYFQASLVTFLKCLGSKSKQLATVLNNIGRLYYLEGHYLEAVAAYSEALNIRQELLGSDSIDVAASMCNAGQTYHQLGQHEKAMSHYKNFLAFAEKHFGPDHRDVAIIFRCVAELYHDQGMLDDAKEWYEKSLKVGRIAVGSNHPEVAATLNKLASLHYERHELDMALKFYQEGLSIERNVLDLHHPYIIVSLANIAQIYRHQEKYDEALLKYSQIHTIQLKVYGPDSIEVGNTVSSMALMQFHLKAYMSAYELYRQAYRIQRKHFGTDDNLEIASTLSSMGLVSFNRGLLEPSMGYFSRSLEIRTKILGKDHKDLAILWYNIATIYLEQGEDEEAIKIYKEALRIETAALGNDHNDVILTQQHIGLVYQRRGQLAEALVHLNQALDALLKKEKRNAVAVAKLLNLIGNIYLQSNQVEKMMKSYTMAARIYRESKANETLTISGYNLYGLSKMHPPCAPLA